MYKFINATVVIVSFIFAGLSSASNVHTDKDAKAKQHWLQRIQQRYEQLRAIQADFDQEISSPRLGSDKSRGKVFFKFPGQMFWDYAAPQAKQVGSDGAKSWIVDTHDKQILVSTEMQETAAMSFLWGKGNLPAQFRVADLIVESGSATLYLMPIKPLPGVEKIKIIYDDHQGIIKTIALYDLLGNLNTITFTKVEIDPNLSPQLFKLKVPPGFAVIGKNP